MLQHNNQLVDLATAAELIRCGYLLSVAGSEALLDQLPTGSWIGGTSHYFMAEEGGVHSEDLLLVTFLPCGAAIAVKAYDRQNIHSLIDDAPENGFSYVIMPSGAPTLQYYSAECRRWGDLFRKPIFGWIAGVDLSALGHARSKIYDGSRRLKFEDGAVVIHVTLPSDQFASLETINVFDRRENSVVRFPREGTLVNECTFNGEPALFGDLLALNGDPQGRLPLLGDFQGASLNVSIQQVGKGSEGVSLYAPVFPDVDYHLAIAPDDYAKAIANRFVTRQTKGTICTCCCILHYVYGRLEGKKVPKLAGPLSFGEIAYLVHNQTIALLRVQ